MPKENAVSEVDALPMGLAKPALRALAMAFIRKHGVVLESAKGLEPSIAEWLVGEPISGGWWGHAKGHEIHELTQQLRDANVLLVCTLAKGRILYIHKRLWPAFVKLAARWPRGALDSVREVHTPSGRHKRQDVPFPRWVPDAVLAAADALPIRKAEAALSLWLARYGN